MNRILWFLLIVVGVSSLRKKTVLPPLFCPLDVENKPHYDDILFGEHPLIINGTNVDLSWRHSATPQSFSLPTV